MSILTVVGFSARTLRVGPLTLDLDRCLVDHSGIDIPTSQTEFAILRALVVHRNVPIGREAMARMVFGSCHKRDPRQIDAFVARLRHSLARAGVHGIISTVAGRGYAVIEDGDRAEGPDDLRPSMTDERLVA